MAFTLNTFQFNRGITSCAANGNGIAPVIHTYGTTDTVAAATTPGYFPTNIDGTDDKIFVQDLLLIAASDGIVLVEITGVAPITLGADLLGSAGSPIVMSTPVPAVDANGAIVTGTTLQLELADQTHAGVLSSGAQVLGGLKTFNNGIQLATTGGTPATLNDYEEFDYVSVFNNNSEATAAVTFKVTKVGRAITIRSTTSPTSASQVTPAAAFTAVTPLPVRMRPAQACHGFWRVSNGGTFQNGAISIETTGVVNIYNNVNFTTGFTGGVTNGFDTCAFGYSL
jgi:hypothetical protein